MTELLAPAVTRVLNLARREGIADWERVAAAVADARAESDAIGVSVSAGLPLLAAMDGADRAGQAFYEALQAQKSALDRLEALCREQEETLLTYALEQLEQAGQKLAGAVEELQRMRDHMPRFSDLSVVNDAFVLALHILRGKSDAKAAREALRGLLAPLYEFSQFLQRAIDSFRAGDPHETEILAQYDTALADIKQAVGGIYVFLEEGSKKDLSISLTLLDGSIGKIAACLSAMRMAEYEKLEFSETPALDKLYRRVQDLRSGAATPQDVQNAIIALRAFHAGLSRDVYMLETTAWMGAELKADYVPDLIACLDRMHDTLNKIYEQASDAAALETLLQEFRETGVEFDGLQEALEEEFTDRPDLSESGHFQELVNIMQGVYAGHVADNKLQEKADVITQLQTAFRGRLKLQQLHNPDESELVAKILDCLDRQQRGLDIIREYLQTSNRELLPLAYDEILPPTLDLMDVKDEHGQKEAESNEVHCPFCGTANPLGSSRCAQCARPLAVGGVAVGLDLYDGGGGESPQEEPLSESFAFVVQVLEGAETGLVPPDEARDMLAPFWDTIHSVEQSLQASVQQTVSRAQDTGLAQSAEDFQALVDGLKSVLTDAFQTLENGHGDLAEIRSRLVDLGGLLSFLHREQQKGTRA